jgi:V8-like Glu-specific endopeptidase
MSSSTHPYSAVCYITDTIDGVNYQASGVLIAPDEVLTAAHVVYSSDGGTATDIQVTPGYDGTATGAANVAPYGTATGLSFHYNLIQDPDDTISNQQSQYDYAVIHLSTSFASAGVMALDPNQPGGAAIVSGYPADASGVQVDNAEAFTLEKDDTLYSGLTIGAGSSGGPVWITSNGTPEIIGLVSSGNYGTDAGYFTQITTTAYDTIESWVAEDNPCFLQGTRIATTRGDVPVEALTTDDIVLTRFGGPTRVVWLGHRHVVCRRHPRPHDVWPVRVRAHAFGHGRPQRDLLLSPDHAVFTGGMLIPVRYLLNGATIVQQPRDTATYWHVELPRHDVLFAEGLAAESYLDTGNRSAFQNGGGATALHPDFARRIWREAGCARLVTDGSHVARASRRLLTRARTLGHAVTDDPGLRVVADGRVLALVREGPLCGVLVPADTARLRLISRTWVAAHMRPGETDTRRLGVAIAKIWLNGAPADLASPALSDGWQAPEAEWRWTDGDAALPVANIRAVHFQLAMAGEYWLASAAAAHAA